MIIKRNIMLIGSMGSGKSHFGRNLAERKGWQFVDTDRVLEGRFGLPIAEIFKKIGEKAFRRAEMDVLKKVCLYHEAVISVGGNFPIEHRTLKVLKKYSYIIGIRAAQFRIVSRVNRRIGKRPTMDYNNVHAFVHAMIQSWKPVYKQCDFVLDTTNGRTYDFMQRIEDELVASGVQFKARRQPNDMNNGDDKESSQELKLNNSVTRNTNDSRIPKKIEAHKRTSQTLGSNKVGSNTSCCDKRRKQKPSNQKGKGRKSEAISKQHAPQGGNGYEKSRNTNKRRRRTWHERRHQIHEGFEVFGVERGYLGIMEEQFIPLSNRSVGGIITQGGTMLKTARFPEFQNEDVQKKAYDILKSHSIDHLIVIGGDGSMRGATSLAKLGMSTMTIPCTIDNDMGGTQYTIGFDTALNTVVDAVGRIRDTSNSHERVAIVEVMGRKAGHIALKAGLACGAEIVLVPENPTAI